jgi:hypothetical protein
LRLILAGAFERLQRVFLTDEDVDRLVIPEFNECPGAHAADGNE